MRKWNNVPGLEKSEYMISEMTKKFNEIADFAKITEADVARLAPVVNNPHKATGAGKLYAIRTGAWVLVVTWYGSQNDGYAAGSLVPVPLD